MAARAEPAQDGPLFRFDPGWLFLLSGIALIAAAVLIPGMDDLAEAEWHRDGARALERYRSERLENYVRYFDALAEGDERVVRSLAATQLNLAPAGARPLVGFQTRGPDASVFPQLEPRFHAVAKPERPDSRLQRWVTGDRSRLLLIGGGAMAILVGLLPPATRNEGPSRIAALWRRLGEGPADDAEG